METNTRKFRLSTLLHRFGPRGFLVIDFESRATVDIFEVGATVYAQHPDTRLWCMSYKLIHPTMGILATRLWLNGEDIPGHVRYALKKGLPVYAHNSGFERDIWRFILHERDGWPDIPFDRWRCSAAQANACAMPRQLFSLCKALDLPVQKDQEGHSLMQKMAKPRKPKIADKMDFLAAHLGDEAYTKKDLRGFLKEPWAAEVLANMPTLWHDTPEQIKRLGEYCVTDTDAEFSAMVSMPTMSPRELRLWQLDQEINLRGVPCDVESIEAALKCLGRMSRAANDEMEDLTAGLVATPDQRDKLKDFCHFMGVMIPDVKAETVDAYLTQDIPFEVRRVLEIRQLMAKASVKKYMAMWNRLRYGNTRLFGLLIFMGAQKTGRWSSGGVQLHNMARGKIKDMDIIEFCIDCVHSGAMGLLDELYSLVTDVFSSLTRPMICAPPGMTLYCADFLSIEVRVAFWLARQMDALDVMTATDSDPDLPDIYEIRAGNLYAIPARTVNGEQRGHGKIGILGPQYGMAENALQKQAKEWGLDLSIEFCESMKDSYRDQYTKVCDTWKAYDKAVKRCIRDRAKVKVDRVTFEVKGQFLYVHLPSGRKLHYHRPGLKRQNVKNKDGSTWKSMQIRYWGRDSQTKQWKRLKLYGAKIFQHIVQALARDIMAEAMLRVNPWYPVILTVHDEIISEIRKALTRGRDFVQVDFDLWAEENRSDTPLSLENFIDLMSQRPLWALDCPIKADGWQGRRYRK